MRILPLIAVFLVVGVLASLPFRRSVKTPTSTAKPATENLQWTRGNEAVSAASLPEAFPVVHRNAVRPDSTGVSGDSRHGDAEIATGPIGQPSESPSGRTSSVASDGSKLGEVSDRSALAGFPSWAPIGSRTTAVPRQPDLPLTFDDLMQPIRRPKLVQDAMEALKRLDRQTHREPALATTDMLVQPKPSIGDDDRDRTPEPSMRPGDQVAGPGRLVSDSPRFESLDRLPPRTTSPQAGLERASETRTRHWIRQPE